MTTDLEDRLRTDLPRLAIHLQGQPEDAGVVRKSWGSLWPLVAAAVAVLLAGTMALLVVSRDTGPETIVVTDGEALAPGQSIFDGGWTPILDAPLSGRARPVVVDMGERAFVWGGHANLLALQSGAVFDGGTLAWTATPDNAWAHPGGTGAWTGEVVVVLAKNGGATFDPRSGEWSDLPQIDDFRAGFREAHFVGDKVIAVGWATELVTGTSTAQVAILELDGEMWTSDAVLHGTLDVDLTQGALIGDTPVVWDGAVSAGWTYDIDTGGWAEVPPLVAPGGVAIDRSSVHAVDSEMVVVASVDGGIRTAVLRGGEWRWSGDAVEGLELGARLTSTGPGAAVLARTADGQTTVVVATADEVSELRGFPLRTVTDPGAVWLDDGLFVWGGEVEGEPSARGGFWQFRRPESAGIVDPHGEVGLPAIFDRPRRPGDELQATEETMFNAGLWDGDRSRRIEGADGAVLSIVPGHDDRSFCLNISAAGGGGGGGCVATAEVVTAGWFGVATDDTVAGVVAPGVEAVRVAGRSVAVRDQVFFAESNSGLDVELIWSPERAATVEACDLLGVAANAMNRLDAPEAATLERLEVVAGETGLPGLSGLVDHAAEAGDPTDMSDAAIAAFSVAPSTCRTELVPGWAVVYTPPVEVTLMAAVEDPGDLGDVGTIQVQQPTDARVGSVFGVSLGPVTRFEVEGQAVFTWTEDGGASRCVGFVFEDRSESQCGAPPTGIITRPLDDGSDRSIYLWRAPDPTARYVTLEIAGETLVQEVTGGLAAFVAGDGTPRFGILSG